MDISNSLQFFLKKHKESVSKSFNPSESLAQILTTSESDLSLAGTFIQQGKLVAFPTETVYGLGADALNETAVHQIFKAKGQISH